MRPDPEPYEAIRRLDSQGAVMIANPGRPVATDFLEMERRVAWILLEMLERLVAQYAYRLG